jgi:D-alanine-D-alanine ligase
MKKVAVIFGSRSTEHDVSIVTAINAVITPLASNPDYEPVPVYIARDGAWYSEPELGTIQFFSGGDVAEKLKKFKKLNLKFDDGLWLIKPGLAGQKIKIDMVFPATHGTYGEDGSLMGLLRMADVPFVGCDVAASAIAMDKVLTKILASQAGLNTPKYLTVSKAFYSENADSVVREAKKLTLPVFVKPTHLGSSIGISRVEDAKDLKNAIELALHYDTAVLIEEAVQNLIEVTVPVLGNENPRVAMVEQSLNHEAAFFDFQTKYMNQGKGKVKDGSSKSQYSTIPADISKSLYTTCEEVALAAYKAIGAEGTARIDLLIDTKAKQVYVNEINPMPGSLYKHNWQEAGISNQELVLELLTLAQQRYERDHEIQTSFDTNYLRQF